MRSGKDADNARPPVPGMADGAPIVFDSPREHSE